MLTFNQRKLEIVQVDNGYVIEWRDESRRDVGAAFSYPQVATPTNGVVICADKAATLKYVDTFFKGK